MSKTFRIILLILTCGTLAAMLAASANGQEMTVNIKVTGTTAQIEGGFRGSRKEFVLLNEYAGASSLAARVRDIQFNASDGQTIVGKQGRIGEYTSDIAIERWKYSIDLRPMSNAAAQAHTSWISADVGLLMLDDLLPQIGEMSTAKIKVELPEGWGIYGVSARVNSEFDVPRVSKASFVIGRGLRERAVDVGETRINVVTTGEWQFTDQDAADSAKEIFDRYVKVFGSSPTKNVQVAILRFPGDVPLGNWEADTRGTSVTILSSDMPFRTQAVQRLHEQLRHELFHIWLPNGVSLTGNYDWFYEGFALYQSLKLGVAVNRLRFDDYLDTMSRAFSLDELRPAKAGLIAISKERFRGTGSQLYARGMVTAFLCDLVLLSRSKGKVSTDNLIRELFQKHPLTASPESAEIAILKIMRSHSELEPVIQNYIVGVGSIDLAGILAAAGLERERRTLRVTAKPSGRQKDLLDKLGYNNWRRSGTR